jgi:hypothetical protein
VAVTCDAGRYASHHAAENTTEEKEKILEVAVSSLPEHVVDEIDLAEDNPEMTRERKLCGGRRGLCSVARPVLTEIHLCGHARLRGNGRPGRSSRRRRSW